MQEEQQKQATEPVISTPEQVVPTPEPEEQHFTVSGGPETLIEQKQKEIAADILFPESVVETNTASVVSPVQGVQVPQTAILETKDKTEQMPKLLLLITFVLLALTLIFRMLKFNNTSGIFLLSSMAVCAVIAPIVLFIASFFTKKRLKLIGIALLFFVGACLIGLGSCFFAFR